MRSTNRICVRDLVLAHLDVTPGGETAWQIAQAVGIDPKAEPNRLRAVYMAIGRAERDGLVERKMIASNSFKSYRKGKVSLFFSATHAPSDTEQKRWRATLPRR